MGSPVLFLLAFACHTLCELAEDLWRRAMQKAGTRTSPDYSSDRLVG